MDINQEFANSVNDPTVRGLMNEYVSSRDEKVFPCNCGGTTTKRCIGVLRTCIQTNAPEGGVYTKLDQTGGIDFRASHTALLNDLNAKYYTILNKISEKKIFIEDPPHPEDPDLQVKMENAKDEIEKMALVLNEISYYINQIKIDLA